MPRSKQKQPKKIYFQNSDESALCLMCQRESFDKTREIVANVIRAALPLYANRPTMLFWEDLLTWGQKLDSVDGGVPVLETCPTCGQPLFQNVQLFMRGMVDSLFLLYANCGESSREIVTTFVSDLKEPYLDAPRAD